MGLRTSRSRNIPDADYQLDQIASCAGTIKQRKAKCCRNSARKNVLQNAADVLQSQDIARESYAGSSPNATQRQASSGLEVVGIVSSAATAHVLVTATWWALDACHRRCAHGAGLALTQHKQNCSAYQPDAPLAQSAERTTFNRVAVGSSPTGGDLLNLNIIVWLLLFFSYFTQCKKPGRWRAATARTCAVCIELSALCFALLTSLLQNRINVIHFRLLSSPQRFVAVYWAFESGICCCFL